VSEDKGSLDKAQGKIVKGDKVDKMQCINPMGISGLMRNGKYG